MAYALLKWLHIVAAIVALGANATYGIWIARASRTPAALPFTLRMIKFLDDRVANPCYGLLLLTGFGMIYTMGLRLRIPWLLTSLVLYVVMGLIAAFGYTPLLKRQIDVLDRDGFESPTYQALAARGRTLGIVLGIFAMVIVFLMVVKPRLWA
jgi:uncharacterized membrane protein